MKATRIEQPSQATAKPNSKPPQSSRSFGFKDKLPYSLAHEPTFAEHALDWFTNPTHHHSTSMDNPIIDLLLDI